MPIDLKKAAAYTGKQIAAGKLTNEMIATMVADRQADKGLLVDGMPGPDTLATFGRDARALAIRKVRVWPLRRTADGRAPVITSGHSSKNPSRPNHHGVDIMYVYRGDVDEPIYAAAHAGKAIPTVDPPGGDAGAAAAHKGVKRWWVPDGTPAIAVGDGKIVAASVIGTGGRIWLDLGDRIYAGYMHLSSLAVKVGQVVVAGQVLGIVGDSTAEGHDPRHLHFELYDASGASNDSGPPDDYAAGTLDPEAVLERDDHGKPRVAVMSADGVTFAGL